ncbi:MAG: FkbM family methyltransferase [Ilumatobacter sp.]|mgnify:CR=1 FL=1|jgi:hypothetical protein|uniref:FkbM family methyltransferase n=1 Tax=uncultured Ilumatobacter sp. TaxID=879968 RepID=UPI00374E66AF|nr:FkbM family methyltransferase [Ilumatobacter sp.]
MKNFIEKFTSLAYWLRTMTERVIKQPLQVQQLHAEIERLRERPRYQDRKCLVPFGHKVYSQNDEDGIIREIFNRIGVTNRTFVEFGVGNGLENNTLALLFDGWNGLWIEGSCRYVKKIREGFSTVVDSGQLAVTQSFITTENINGLISRNIAESEIDLLSIDIDGNDFHIFKSIDCVRPRVVVIEYNAKFVPPVMFCMQYNKSHAWASDDCFSASLKYLEVNFAAFGYSLVGCSVTGVNAFFVRNDLVEDNFLEPFTAEHHFEPARYFLAGIPSGHRPSYRTLETSLPRR